MLNFKRKTIYVLMVAIILVMSVTITSFASAVEYGLEYENKPSKEYLQKFSDVPQDYWAFMYIAEMEERGVLQGYPDGRFRPENVVSRAEFAKVMVSAAGLTVERGEKSSFEDVKLTDWHLPFVEVSKNYLTGYRNQSGQLFFKPDSPTLREDVAVALVKLKGYDTKLADESIIRAMFKDFDGISNSARSYVAIAVENGLISGYGDETFKPQNPVTRAEAATLLWRAYQYGNVTKFTDITDIKETYKAEEINRQVQKEKEDGYKKNPQIMEGYNVDTILDIGNVTYIHSEGRLVVDKSHTVYYLDEKEIKVYNKQNGSPQVLVNFSEDLPLKEGKVIKESGFSAQLSFAPKLVYDKYRDKVYLVGKYRQSEQLAIYEVFNDSIEVVKIFSKSETKEYMPSFNSSQVESVLVVEDGGIIIGMRSGSTGWVRIGLKIQDNRIRRFHLGDVIKGSLFEINNDFFIVEGKEFSKYNFATGMFEEIESDHPNFFPANDITTYKESLYYASSNSIYRLSTEGDSTLILTPNDIEILDGLTFNISKLFINNDDEFIFYDRNNQAIRVIQKNN
ncbi:MAG: S-layer homology domain-containing protein [Clostridiaceae bacterium]|nr:S-layer homology domain-containing protein [Clostridiaceae bacterium]